MADTAPVRGRVKPLPERIAQPLRFVSRPAPAPGVALLELAGALDEHGLREAGDAIGAVLTDHPALLLLSLTGVTRMDGAGLVLLTAMCAHADHAGVPVSVVDGKRRLRGHPGVTATLAVYPSVSAALRRRQRFH
jgi:ABC-type transporter Mla MlaB component